METERSLPLITIVLDRLRSAFNTGNIFRLAEAVGETEIVACGYTPRPPHPKLAKTAMTTDEMVPCRWFTSSAEAVMSLRSEGIRQVVAVETIEDGESFYPWDCKYDFPVAIVLGNEALGIEEDTLKMCDCVVQLPMFGKKKSINVGNCAAVVLYSIVASMENSKNNGCTQ